jgi:hypothetical protein
MLVYPVNGRRVRCPVTRRPVPADGLTVPEHDMFWHRRLRDGDVTLEAPPVAEAAQTDADPAPPAEQLAGADALPAAPHEEHA